MYSTRLGISFRLLWMFSSETQESQNLSVVCGGNDISEIIIRRKKIFVSMLDNFCIFAKKIERIKVEN